MKKIAIAVLGAVLAVTGCSKKNAADAKITKENLKVGFVYIGSIHDEGYTTAQDQGRLALEEQGIKTMYVENVPENADCEKVIRDLIDQGCNVIYTTSFGFMDWTIKVAKDFPNVKFGHCSGRDFFSTSLIENRAFENLEGTVFDCSACCIDFFLSSFCAKVRKRS